MTDVFKPILEEMARGEIGQVYADAVIHLEKKQIVWDGTKKSGGSIALYSRNEVDLTGTAVALHPAVLLKEHVFQGNTTLHYELLPGKVCCQKAWKTDGILICYNGGEYVIPLYIKAGEPENAEAPEGEITLQQKDASKPADLEVSVERKVRKAQAHLMRCNLKRMVLLRNMQRDGDAEALDERSGETESLLEEMAFESSQLAQWRPEVIRYRLYEAEIILEKGEITRAARLENRIRNVILAAKKKHGIEYCMLLHIQYRLAAAQGQLHEAAVKKQQLGDYIETVLEKNPGDADLILLLNSSCLSCKAYDPLGLWESLRFLYQNGNNSPYLFFFGGLLLCDLSQEAFKQIQQPGLEDWTLRCLQAVVKNGWMTPEFADRVFTGMPYRCTPYVCRLYETVYQNAPSEKRLADLCMVLIRCGIQRESAFPYYEQAVEGRLKIARLYDYYIYALPPAYEKPLPREVLQFFMLDRYINPQIYIKLSLNVLRFYADDSSIYDFYHKNVESVLKNQILHNCWSENLAYLAEEVLQPDMLDQEFAAALIPMLYLVQVKTKQPDGSQVIYKSGIYKEEQTAVLKNGSACLWAPGGCGSFYLKDCRGRLVSGIKLKIRPLMQDEELMETCEALCPQDERLLLLKTHAWIMQKNYEACDVRLCFEYLKDESLDMDFRMQILEYLLEYLKKRPEDIPDVRGLCACARQMEEQQLVFLIEILIQRGYYTEASEFLTGISLNLVDEDALLQLVQALAQYPENTTNPFLSYLMKYLFEQELLNDSLLSFFVQYAEKTGETQRALYAVCMRHKMDCGELEKRMLLRLLMKKDPEWNLLQQLLIQLADHSPLNQDQDERLLQATLNRICGAYLFDWCSLEADVVSVLQALILRMGTVEELTIPCQLACLKYDQEIGLDHDMERMVWKQMCENLKKERIELSFVEREAAGMGMPAVPVIDVNLSHRGDFSRNLLEEIRQDEGIVWAEYRVKKNPPCRVPVHPAYGFLYSARILAFAGEQIQYRFCCQDETTDWKEFSPWNFPVKAQENKNRGMDRYGMLQEIALCLQAGEPADESMQEYRTLLSLVESIGK